jgi:asparagine synthase (glutamine-hydrolysing)
MCGIAGILNLDRSAPVNPDQIKRMCDVIWRRGPDSWGSFISGNVGMGMRRLSIIDLSGGDQPIFNEDGTVAIVFNGEIYNYKELRSGLKSRGHTFRTNTDTEVIVHLYEEYGPSCVERLRGMFAFAICDSRHSTLFVARDRLGIKPVYYWLTDDKLVFASEIKAILSMPDFQRAIDWKALEAYFTFSYIPSSLSIFQGIRKLPPGHYMVCKQGRVSISQYWDLCFRSQGDRSFQQLVEETRDLLSESVRIRLMSDVPLGAFLSGGIDSGSVVALMALNSGDRVNTFTVGFGGSTSDYFDERSLAKSVARRYATNHEEHEVLPDVENVLHDIVCAFDEPMADETVIPTYHICRVASRKLKVALSGLGGDEAFGGYDRYLGLCISHLYSALPSLVRSGVIRPVVESLPERQNGDYFINHLKRFVRASGLPPARRYLSYTSRLLSVSSAELLAGRTLAGVNDLMLPLFMSENADALLHRAIYQDVKTYLPDDILAVTDRLSMWHSLEVRVPFLDHKLLEFCATVPPKAKIRFLEKKYLLKRALSDLLPAKVLQGKKKGFVGPTSLWLQDDLSDFVRDTLSEQKLKSLGYFEPRCVRDILRRHAERREDFSKLIWALLVFVVWHRIYMENRD